MRIPALPVLLAAFALHSAVAIGQSIPVADKLADMVEQVVRETGISINIARQTRTSLTIDKVNGTSVCAPEVRATVEMLQTAFEGHENIYRNFGPALASITQSDGTKQRVNLAELQPNGAASGCQGIYVSIRE